MRIHSASAAASPGQGPGSRPPDFIGGDIESDECQARGQEERRLEGGARRQLAPMRSYECIEAGIDYAGWVVRQRLRARRRFSGVLEVDFTLAAESPNALAVTVASVDEVEVGGNSRGRIADLGARKCFPIGTLIEHELARNTCLVIEPMRLAIDQTVAAASVRKAFVTLDRTGGREGGGREQDDPRR